MRVVRFLFLLAFAGAAAASCSRPGRHARATGTERGHDRDRGHDEDHVDSGAAFFL
jgi:hypothetical protein